MKKCNAFLSLITITLLLAHAAVNTYFFVMHTYIPKLSKIGGFTLVGCMALHAILSIGIFFSHDSKKITYPKKNVQTLLQRISAVCMIVLIVLHINTMTILMKNFGKPVYFVVAAVQILFFASCCIHISVSFSKALITLGILKDNKKRKVVDIIATVCSILLFVFLSFYFTVGEYMMIGGMQA